MDTRRDMAFVRIERWQVTARGRSRDGRSLFRVSAAVTDTDSERGQGRAADQGRRAGGLLSAETTMIRQMQCHLYEGSREIVIYIGGIHLCLL